MRKSVILIIFLLFFILLTGCFRHVHTVGSGPHIGKIEEEKQWYILWGIMSLNDVDGGVIAENTNCRITTECKPMDCVINFFTGVVSIYRTSVTVEK